MKPSVAWRQAVLLTLGALALVTGLHFVPSGGGLSHLDFIPGGPDALQFCDPANPQFLPVVARSSPVTLLLQPATTPEEGQPVSVRLSLHTITGKPIGPADLLPTATQKILLLLVDPGLGDFQTAIPEPAATPGEWQFTMTPRRAGPYRVFADLTPTATGREMYASADLPVSAAGSAPEESAATRPDESYHFDLRPSAQPVYARQPVDLRLSVTAAGGGMVPLVPSRGTFAHLTAFDQARTGLVNVPGPVAGSPPPDPFHPALSFRVTFPDPGHYVVWSQVSLNGQMILKAFPLDVQP